MTKKKVKMAEEKVRMAEEREAVLGTTA